MQRSQNAKNLLLAPTKRCWFWLKNCNCNTEILRVHHGIVMPCEHSNLIWRHRCGSGLAASSTAAPERHKLGIKGSTAV